MAFLPIIIYIVSGFGLFRSVAISSGYSWAYLSVLILVASLVFGFIAIKHTKERKIKGRLMAVIGIIISIFLLVFLISLIIGFSRVYLDVHWFSDIIGGFSLGLFWLTLLILVFKVIISLSKKHYA